MKMEIFLSLSLDDEMKSWKKKLCLIAFSNSSASNFYRLACWWAGLGRKLIKTLGFLGPICEKQQKENHCWRSLTGKKVPRRLDHRNITFFCSSTNSSHGKIRVREIKICFARLSSASTHTVRKLNFFFRPFSTRVWEFTSSRVENFMHEREADLIDFRWWGWEFNVHE